MNWYQDPKIFRRLPLLFRIHAAYCRATARFGTSRGRKFLHARVARLTRLLHLRDSAVLKSGELNVWVDLCDWRWSWVVREVRGDNEETRLLRTVLAPGDTFLDIGANHGSYALLAAKIVGDKGKVVAFEPQLRLAALLARSFKANRMAQARVVEVACSDQQGTTSFYIPESGSGSGGVYKTFSGAVRHEVLQVTLDKLDNLLSSDEVHGKLVIKLDVEGNEMKVLRGGETLLRAHKPLILFELNPASAQAAGGSGCAVPEALSALGYERFSEVESYPQTVKLNDLDCTQQRNLIAF